MTRTIAQGWLVTGRDRGRRGSGAQPPPPSRRRVRSSSMTAPFRPALRSAACSDIEWGWLVAAILFGWISTRAEQATAEQLDTERTIRMTALDPEPWDAGAVATILPELADACPDIDWSQPLGAWPRETMVEFLLVAMRLIRKAMIARDLSESGITRKSSAEHDRAPSQCGRRRTVDDAGRAQ